MTVKNYYCNLTEYCKIFENSYWGNFDNNLDELEKEIITNRNNFVRVFEIIKYKSIPKKCEKYFCLDKRYEEYKDFFDHTEEYKTKNGYVVICSPYYAQDELAKKLGYKKYNKLYSNSAFTYIKQKY